MFDRLGVLEDATTTIPAMLSARPGSVVGLEGSAGMGLTRLGLSMLAPAARIAPVAFVDVRGWFHPPAAWEAGIEPEQLVVVRSRDRLQWPRVVAALVEGMGAVYAEVPNRIPEQLLRRLGALVRARGASLVLRPLAGALPSGVAYLRVRGTGVVWEGAEDGHGRLLRRRLLLEISGKNLPEQTVMVEDDGWSVAQGASATAAG